MKYLVVIILALCLYTATFCQKKTTDRPKLFTMKYAGLYSYGTTPEKGRIGSIIIYPETDSTILFNLDLCRGAPSYNLGSLNGRLRLVNDSSVYYEKMDYTDGPCKLVFKFDKNMVRINTDGDQSDCGFGGNVFADGIYSRKSRKVIDRFIGMEGDTVYFKSLKLGN